MNVQRRLVEASPSIRWNIGRLKTALLYRKAFRRVGAGSVIVSPLTLRGVADIAIGDDCAIYEGAWMQCEAGGTIDLGDRTYIGHNVHIHAGHPIAVGTGCVFADGVMVTTTDHDRFDRHVTHSTGPITIGNDVFIGERVIVLGNVTIGDGATIGAASVVTRDVSPGDVVAGIPARPIGKDTP